MNIISKPDEMKIAIIIPILRKSSLDSETQESYQSISNMSFLSKLLGRIMADELIVHKHENGLYIPLQSAYQQNCNTESALLHTHDSVIRSMDERKGLILLLFDMMQHLIQLITPFKHIE